MGQFCTSLRHQHGPKGPAQTRKVCLAFGGIRTPLLQGCGTYMVLSCSTSRGLTMVFGGLTSYSYQAVLCYPGDSSSASLHYVHILLLSLPSLRCALAYLRGSWGLWGHLRSAAPNRVVWHWTRVFSGLLCPTGPHDTGLRVIFCPSVPSGTGWE